MAEEKPQSSDHSIGSQRGLPHDQDPSSGNHAHAPSDPGKPTLAEAHGAGIAGTSNYDLTGNLRGTESSLVSQGFPQPSGGATGSRPQQGSFESGKRDTDTSGRGEPSAPLSPASRPKRDI